MPALYQRARPIRFGEVVGQEHVIEVLGTAVRRGRIGHAYLFSGPRGVGKTTTARLLAMAANCEAAEPAQRPCGQCESCRLVQQGAHPDVTELDAASNNSVEDVRDLREKVGLAGLRGGTRVWILDEAHMLSRAAANALLKTLEEPPPGLLFILATTEPEKLPPTILSRCQHFRFRRLSEEEIVGKLMALCESAEVSAEDEALRLVARAAEGGMRDAESLLERLLVMEGGVTAAHAEQTLGLAPRARLEAMAAALAEPDLAALLGEAAALYRAGFSPRSLSEQLGRTLRDALLGSLRGGGFSVGMPDGALMRCIQALDDEQERFVRHNDLYSLEVALIKALSATGSGAVAAGPQAATKAPGTPVVPEARLEAAPAAAGGGAPQRSQAGPAGAGRDGSDPAGTTQRDRAAPERAAAKAASEDADAAVAPADTAGPVDTEAPRPATRTKRTPARTATTKGASAASESVGSDAPPERRPLAWREVKAQAGPQLKAFLKPAVESVEGDTVRLSYDEVHRFHHGQLLARSSELAALVREVAGPGYTILVEGPEGGAPKKIA
jgi:DNA polymerase III subunit gamma/tau